MLLKLLAICIIVVAIIILFVVPRIYRWGCTSSSSKVRKHFKNAAWKRLLFTLKVAYLKEDEDGKSYSLRLQAFYKDVANPEKYKNIFVEEGTEAFLSAFYEDSAEDYENFLSEMSDFLSRILSDECEDKEKPSNETVETSSEVEPPEVVKKKKRKTSPKKETID